MTHGNGQAIQANQVQQGFGQTLATSKEVGSTAISQRVMAQIQMRTFMAQQNPRDLDQVRAEIIKECKRPGFAAAARYSLPRAGGRIEGPTIRFAEAAIRCMRNIAVETTTIQEDDRALTMRISVTDLEANVPYEHEVTIQKRVERSYLKDGQVPLGERINSSGKRVFLVEATEDDVLMKTNAIVSKAVRTLGLRHIPGHILEEAMELCQRVAAQADSADPTAARRVLFDAFASVGVKPVDLKEYMGNDLEVPSPNELAELRSVLAAVKAQEITWQDAFDAKHPPVVESKDGKQEPVVNDATKRTQDILAKRQKVQAETAKKEAAQKGKISKKGDSKSQPRAAEKPQEEPPERQPGEDDE